MSLSPRNQAIQTVLKRTPRKVEPPKDKSGRTLKISEFFGCNTFSADQMKKLLSKDIHSRLHQTIESGEKLERDVADGVADAVKEWALERGVTHFCHWFQPQTGTTAEKHDAFLDFGDKKQAIERFKGSQLIQSEPDASSFPSGGMRTTFEARGYTAWDPSSPIFIMESTNSKTLCIPSVFISYHGDALDKKAGLIRSIEALSERACELLKVLGDTTTKRVLPTLGCEQEYFLIDRAFTALRPDLVMSGRTLVGGQPPRGQQLEDHYWGSIPSRVQAFMSEFEFELYKLGVPVKTRHNEVAPSQYETAPIFEEANVAIDHNQLVMELLRKVSRRHEFEVLLHEKPFAGINGSGKHCNWSLMGMSEGTPNLLEPGKTPEQNLRFLVFLVATLKGVYQHAGLLRAAIASSGNDHRLGANEAPPAIISIFMGDMLNRILDDIEKDNLGESPVQGILNLGVAKLPEVMKDNTDRNRTSPFAFTGNKFEFRAVGSSASPTMPVTFLNAAVAEACQELTVKIKAKMQTESSKEKAVFSVLREIIKETKAVRFEGNNYSDEWVKEAEKRGLLNLRKTPEALEQILTEKAKKLLTSMKIFSEAEIVSRFHVRLERFIKNLHIEADTLRTMIDTQIIPAAYKYHLELVTAIKRAKGAGVSAPQADTAGKLATLLTVLQAKRSLLDSTAQKIESLKSETEKAKALAYDLSPVMAEARAVCDELEGIVSDEFWPLPKYREMLFIS